MDSYRMYFRFYPDGRVVNASIAGTVTDPAWLVWGNDHVSSGRYQVADGGEIRFALTSSTGVVEYEGLTAPDVTSIRLNIHSQINGYRDTVEIRAQGPVRPSGGRIDATASTIGDAGELLVFAELLGRILRDFGDAWGNAARLRALLNDLAPPNHGLQVVVLVAACEEGIAREISLMARAEAKAMREHLAARLRTRRAMELEWGRWAVETWVVALHPQA